MKNNKISAIDSILLALMLACLMIGGHQTYVISKTEGFKMGFFKSYWLFMLVFVLIIIYQVRKNKKVAEENKQNKGNSDTSKNSSAKKK